MISKLVSFSKTKIFENAGSLILLQFGNYAVPLIVMPYLISILGLDGFGLYSLVLAIALNCIIITDFGFNIYGVKLVSIARGNSSRINEIYSGIQIIKFAFLIFVASLYALCVFLFDFFDGKELVYLNAIPIMVGQTIIPVWFFQGIERMKYITIVNLLIRFASAALMFILVNKQGDEINAVISQGASYLLAGVLSLIIARYYGKVKFIQPQISDLKVLVNGSKHVFASSFSIGVFRNMNTVILGFFVGDLAVGLYSSSEKVIRAIQGLISPFNSAIYPSLSLKFSKLSLSDSVSELVRYGKYILMLALLIWCGAFFGEPIIEWALQIKEEEYSKVFSILSVLIVLGSLTNFLGVSGLINLGRQKQFSFITMSGAIINVIFSVVFVRYFEVIGVAIAVVVSEFLVLVMIGLELNKLKQLNFG